MNHSNSILDEAWSSAVGGLNWLQSVLLGEFSDNRPLSAIITDMLVSFVPGVVIVTGARDAVAVTIRLAQHPEKREDPTEWMVLAACMITLALPLALAAGGFVAAGVGAAVGGIAGSELGAALRAVMLLLIKEASKVGDVIRFLQKFVKGDLIGFLNAIKFTKYEKALLSAFEKTTGKLITICQALRGELQRFKYFDEVKRAIDTLTEWEQKFYAVQSAAMAKLPLALSELEARLAKLLVQTAPKESHVVGAGVRPARTVSALPVSQRVRDTVGKTLEQPRATSAVQSKRAKKLPLKEKPEPIKPPDEGPNSKKQTVADLALEADRARITKLSLEAKAAEQSGDVALAAAKIEEARDILRPHLPKKPSESWEGVIGRLDVASPKDGAVFWSGNPRAAQGLAEKINGVTLETTAGGRIIDGWDEVNKGYAWDSRYGTPPYGRDLWAGISKKYAEGVTGIVNAVQTPEKLWDTGSLWHNVEKPIFQDKILTGEVRGINMYTIDNAGEFVPLSKNYINSLLRLEGEAP